MLLLALLCLLALEVSAAGLHYVATQELRTAHAVARSLDLRLAAQSGIARALATWPAPGLDDMALHASAPVNVAGIATAPGIDVAVTVERVAPRMFLIRSTATSALKEVFALGFLAAVATPDVVAGTLSAALRTNAPVQLGPGADITSSSAACDHPSGQSPHAVEIGGSRMIAMSGGQLHGPVADTSAELEVMHVGPASLIQLRELARASAGNPNRAVSYMEGDVMLDGDALRGIVVVAGDLTMRGGSVDGVLLVTGSLTLMDGASVSGAVLTNRRPVTIHNARITRDECIIRAAVAAAGVLGPYRPHGRAWIPLF